MYIYKHINFVEKFGFYTYAHTKRHVYTYTNINMYILTHNYLPTHSALLLHNLTLGRTIHEFEIPVYPRHASTRIHTPPLHASLTSTIAPVTPPLSTTILPQTILFPTTLSPTILSPTLFVSEKCAPANILLPTTSSAQTRERASPGDVTSQLLLPAIGSLCLQVRIPYIHVYTCII